MVSIISESSLFENLLNQRDIVVAYTEHAGQILPVIDVNPLHQLGEFRHGQIADPPLLHQGAQVVIHQDDIPDGVSFYDRSKALGELDDDKNKQNDSPSLFSGSHAVHILYGSTCCSPEQSGRQSDYSSL